MAEPNDGSQTPTEPKPDDGGQTPGTPNDTEAVVKKAVADAVAGAREAFQKRLGDRDDRIKALQAELGEARAAASAAGLPKPEQRQREAAIQAAKDRALKTTTATATLSRVTREAIAAARAAGKVVDVEKVSALVQEFVARTVNPENDVRITVADGGDVEVFMTSAAVEGLGSAVARVVELASGVAEPTPSGGTPSVVPGATPPRERGKSLIAELGELVPIWDADSQVTDVGKARAKIAQAADRAGRDGHLGDMDTAL